MYNLILLYIFSFRKKTLFFSILFLIVICCSDAFSQRESNIWYFGQNAGISFITSPPTAITNGKINTYEGCASICNKNGNLLFYTDGINVWNKNHIVMENGSGLNGSVSSSQSAIIVPEPGSNRIYFIFTTDAVEDTNKNGLKYSVIDMNMNAGLGKVINKNINLIKPTSEKVTVIRHSNAIDFWVITHGVNDSNFLSFLITSSGVNTLPIISSIGTLQKNNYTCEGYLKASNDGKKLVSAKCYSGELELFDFDNLTGKVYNSWQIDNSDFFYGVEFSANNNKLYVSVFSQGSIYQYDLQSANIFASKKIIYSSNIANGGALQIGIDKKIYCSFNISPYLGVINNPDNDSCNFVKNAIFLEGLQCKLGLPNIVPSLIINNKPPVASFIASDTNICQGALVKFTNITFKPTTGQNWLINGLPFDTNKNTSYTFNNAGDFTISLIISKDTFSDTANLIIHVNPIKQTSTYPLICQGDTFKIGINYYITTGTYYDTLTTYLGCDSIVTTNLQIMPFKQTNINPFICPGDTFTMGTKKYTTIGTYFDTLTSYSGCDSIITTNLHVNHPKSNFLPSDTTFCFDNGGLLQLDGGEASEYLWYPTLETGRYQNVISEGIYSLEIKDSIGCKSIDSINVSNVCEMTIFVPNVFAPKGINIVFKAYGTSINHIELKVFNRWGELIYEGSGKDDTSWNGYFHNELCPSGVYLYLIKAIGKNGETKDITGLVQLLR